MFIIHIDSQYNSNKCSVWEGEVYDLKGNILLYKDLENQNPIEVNESEMIGDNSLFKNLLSGYIIETDSDSEYAKLSLQLPSSFEIDGNGLIIPEKYQFIYKDSIWYVKKSYLKPTFIIKDYMIEDGTTDRFGKHKIYNYDKLINHQIFANLDGCSKNEALLKSLYYNKGKFEIKKEDYQNAIKDLTIALDFVVSDNSLGSKINNRILFSRGIAKYENKDYYGAINDFETLINKCKANKECNKEFELYYPKEWMSWEIGSKEAFSLADLYSYLGSAYYAINNDKLALLYISKSLTLDKTDAYSNRLMGLLKLYSNKKSEACKYFSIANQYGDEKAKDYIEQYCK